MRALMFACACVVVVACGKSNTVEEDAGAEITFDASRPDGALPMDAGPEVDAEPPPGESDIGDACRSDSDCEDLCIEDFPGGYCSSICTGDCPAGSTCTPVGGGTSLCLLDCDPASDDPCERPGFGCPGGFMFPSVCIPGCSADSDCPDGLACDPSGGFTEEGTCYDPDAETGGACEDDESCPPDSFCFSEDRSGWPGGACVGFGCDVESNEGCLGDAQCIPGGRGGRCIDGCADGECRDGYRCEPDDDYPDRMICVPGCDDDDQCTEPGLVCNPAVGICDVEFDADELGQPCSTRMGACSGGSCLTEFDSGWPGSVCVYAGCTPGPDDEDGCPGDGVCLANDDGVDFCIQGCDDTDDCLDGYACEPMDPDDESAGMGCMPACENDGECANDGSGGAPDFSCNVGTGLCTYPFETELLGEPCEEGEDCPGGFCVTEDEDGWPAGACVGVGCRVTGEGPEQACPDTGVCVDDEAGDPEIGVCLVACTTEESICRPGYACVPFEVGEVDGACRPACDEDDCGTGLTCNDETGLCEAE